MTTTCESWSDHRFRDGRVTGSGVHQTRGPYVRVERVCAVCGRRVEETQWVIQTTAEQRARFHLPVREPAGLGR